MQISCFFLKYESAYVNNVSNTIRLQRLWANYDKKRRGDKTAFFEVLV